MWQGEADEESPVPDDGLERILGFNSSSLPGLKGLDSLVGLLAGPTRSKESDEEDGDLESLSCLLLDGSGSKVLPVKAVPYEPEVWQGDDEVVSVPNRLKGLMGFDSATPSGLEGLDSLVGLLAGPTRSKESDEEDGALELLSCLLLDGSGSKVSPATPSSSSSEELSMPSSPPSPSWSSRSSSSVDSEPSLCLPKICDESFCHPIFLMGIFSTLIFGACHVSTLTVVDEKWLSFVTSALRQKGFRRGGCVSLRTLGTGVPKVQK